MVKKSVFVFFVILFSLFSFSNIAYSSADVEVFSKYNTYIKVNKDYTFDVHKEIYLRNIHDVGIVPGQVEFKILGTNQKNKGNVLYYNVTDRYGNPIRSQISQTDTGTIILLDIFTPVLPGFEYKIDLKYTIEYDSSGIFFKNIQMPLMEKTLIPIQSGVVEVEVPDSYKITYINYKDANTVLEKSKVSWEVSKGVPEIVDLEYSYIPIRVPGVKGSFVFWIAIDLILIIILIIEVIKEINKLQKGKKD